MDGEPRVCGSLHNVNVKVNVNAWFDIGKRTTHFAQIASVSVRGYNIQSSSGMSTLIFTIMPATFDFS